MSGINTKNHAPYKIAVLYICTGNYYIFWKNFYESAQQYFLPQYDKHYFVFTDDKMLQKFYELDKNITFVEQAKLGWPHDTLMRYKMFMRILPQLEQYTHIYFLNANVIFKQEVGDEFLPDTQTENGITAVIHPGFYNKPAAQFTYDRQPNSLAYIPAGKGKHYLVGGINGGVASSYLKLIRTLNDNINKDLEKNIIALWHDESHFNRYIYDLDYKVKILCPEYAYPEDWNLTHMECKIFLLDKNKLGGHDFMRSQDDMVTYIQKITQENAALRKKQKGFFRFLKASPCRV